VSEHLSSIRPIGPGEDQRVETRRLGGSGLTVPAVGMGTWQTLDVRGAAAEANARDVVAAALDRGMTLFDSSPMYGEAERVLGASLAGRRGHALIATKVWSSSAATARAQIVRLRTSGYGLRPCVVTPRLAKTSRVWRHH